MCADMTTQQPGSGEGLSTCGANTGQSMRANVHLQCPQAGVLFRAVLAKEGRPGCSDRGLSLLFGGTSMALGAVTFGSLRGMIAVFWLGAGGVRWSAFVFLPTAAGTAAETGGGA